MTDYRALLLLLSELKADLAFLASEERDLSDTVMGNLNSRIEEIASVEAFIFGLIVNGG